MDTQDMVRDCHVPIVYYNINLGFGSHCLDSVPGGHIPDDFILGLENFSQFSASMPHHSTGHPLFHDSNSKRGMRTAMLVDVFMSGSPPTLPLSAFNAPVRGLPVSAMA